MDYFGGLDVSVKETILCEQKAPLLLDLISVFEKAYWLLSNSYGEHDVQRAWVDAARMFARDRKL
jgi:hypothetical protein